MRFSQSATTRSFESDPQVPQPAAMLVQVNREVYRHVYPVHSLYSIPYGISKQSGNNGEPIC